jgi:peptidyl-prolyl cis-trans isomerase C
MTTLINRMEPVLPAGKVKVPPRPQTEPVGAISVNGVEISADAIQTEAQHHPAANPGEALAEAARALAVRELLLQRARSLGIAATPETVGDGKRETDEDAAIRALLDHEVTTPRADEAACRRYYEANRHKFRSETLYEARHILFAAPVHDTERREAAKRKAAAAIEQLTADSGRFAELAMAHSDCPSKAQGGSLGQLGRGSTVPEFETALFALEPGQMSPMPAPTPFGYHVIQLERVIPGAQLPFEAVQGRIAGWLEASSWSRAVAQYVGILAGEAEITGISLQGSDGPLVQ